MSKDVELTMVTGHGSADVMKSPDGRVIRLRLPGGKTVEEIAGGGAPTAARAANEFLRWQHVKGTAKVVSVIGPDDHHLFESLKSMGSIKLHLIEAPSGSLRRSVQYLGPNLSDPVLGESTIWVGPEQANLMMAALRSTPPGQLVGIFSSLAPGMVPAQYAQMLDIVAECNGLSYMDTRPAILIEVAGLGRLPRFVKVNFGEALKVIGRNQVGSYESLAKQLAARLPGVCILVTLGGPRGNLIIVPGVGAWHLWTEDDSFQKHNPLGCGDAGGGWFMAAIALGWSPVDAAKAALGASIANIASKRIVPGEFLLELAIAFWAQVRDKKIIGAGI